MTCVILQPSYIPWRGYFHQIQKADYFVFYDDVQYDAHGWRNRNRIKTPQGPQWLTIPVRTKGHLTEQRAICQMEIDWDRPWNRKHLASFRQAYRHAPFYNEWDPFLAEVYGRTPSHLAPFTIDVTIELAHRLGIAHTHFLRSSELRVPGQRTDRILAIVRHLGCDRYVSGPSARRYLEEDRFADAGVALEYMQYDYPEYPQLHSPFDADVTILDLLLMTGPDAPKYIWG
ncbi:MAG TPA: WbqC family protein [Vicinamibacterales bacterium]|nr:WbqC family protein [Vicinamibacterales bacterium]